MQARKNVIIDKLFVYIQFIVDRFELHGGRCARRLCQAFYQETVYAEDRWHFHETHSRYFRNDLRCSCFCRWTSRHSCVAGKHRYIFCDKEYWLIFISYLWMNIVAVDKSRRYYHWTIFWYFHHGNAITMD